MVDVDGETSLAARWPREGDEPPVILVADDFRSARGCGLFVGEDVPASWTERGPIKGKTLA